jgi:CubicO group peptidase (beta-lactamase class C family)
MNAFPPAASGQATLANWRNSPFNRWAFHHVREIIPTADIPNAPDNVWQLPVATTDLGDFSFQHGGEQFTFARALEQTETDGIVVLHKGKVVAEHYANGMNARTPHILMSVSKSLTGIIAGMLIDEGKLDPEAPVVGILPELSGSVYSKTTLRNVLDMRVGLQFDEDYLATAGPIVQYRKSTNWNPLAPGEQADDLRSFLSRMTDRACPDGGPVHYVSTNSDLLGWILERVTRTPFADLLSHRLWQPMGAQSPAYITVDRLGAPRCAGGICTSTLDLALLGQLIVQGGARNGNQIISRSWIQDTLENGDPNAWNDGDLAPYLGDRPMHYRNKWYVLRGDRPLLFGLGVYGQNLFVDPANEMVIAKFSSQAPPLDKSMIALTLRFVEAMRDHLIP